MRPTRVADCLTQPTAMVGDKKTSKLYLTELTGRVVAMRFDGRPIRRLLAHHKKTGALAPVLI
jgi:hypothetical protein